MSGGEGESGRAATARALMTTSDGAKWTWADPRPREERGDAGVYPSKLSSYSPCVRVHGVGGRGVAPLPPALLPQAIRCSLYAVPVVVRVQFPRRRNFTPCGGTIADHPPL
jgi:hypothetical protein